MKDTSIVSFTTASISMWRINSKYSLHICNILSYFSEHTYSKSVNMGFDAAFLSVLLACSFTLVHLPPKYARIYSRLLTFGFASLIGFFSLLCYILLLENLAFITTHGHDMLSHWQFINALFAKLTKERKLNEMKTDRSTHTWTPYIDTITITKFHSSKWKEDRKNAKQMQKPLYCIFESVVVCVQQGNAIEWLQWSCKLNDHRDQLKFETNPATRVHRTFDYF